MEKEKTILNGNKLIAEFMGYNILAKDNISAFEKFGKDGGFYRDIKLLEYHSSWNKLMPVIEKICKLKIGDGDEYVEYACPRTFGMLDKNGLFMFRFNGFQLHSCETLIEAAWFGVIDFIEWYNTK